MSYMKDWLFDTIELIEKKTGCTLNSLYLDLINNFLTLDYFARHYGLTNGQALIVYKFGKDM